MIFLIVIVNPEYHIIVLIAGDSVLQFSSRFCWVILPFTFEVDGFSRNLRLLHDILLLYISALTVYTAIHHSHHSIYCCTSQPSQYILLYIRALTVYIAKHQSPHSIYSHISELSQYILPYITALTVYTAIHQSPRSIYSYTSEPSEYILLYITALTVYTAMHQSPHSIYCYTSQPSQLTQYEHLKFRIHACDGGRLLEGGRCLASY